MSELWWIYSLVKSAYEIDSADSSSNEQMPGS